MLNISTNLESSAVATGLQKVSFNSNLKEGQSETATQLCSFLMLGRLYSKSFKLDFGSMWTKNFQIYQLDLERTEGPEIKFPTSIGS